MRNLASMVKANILTELKKGNMEILKDLSPLESLEYGLALQNESGQYVEKSPIDDKEVAVSMLDRMSDSDVKEQFEQQIEQDNQEYAEKVEIARQITASFNV